MATKFQQSAPIDDEEAEAPPSAPIIVKKVIVQTHGRHHGGAWKVAYADFVTAMMAFFLLLWILGATTEDQRKGIADYFTPTLMQMTNSGGSNGVLGGRSILEQQGVAPHSASRIVQKVVPVATSGIGGNNVGGDIDKTTLNDLAKKEIAAEIDREQFKKVETELKKKLAADPVLRGLKDQVRFVQTKEGLRIEIIDRAGFSMFGLGTTRLVPKANQLVQTVARSISDMPNKLTIRGHTDGVPYAFADDMNNWVLSTQRAEQTRQALVAAGIDPARFSRIEGVADTEPFNAANIYDPRNRRISVTLLYREG